MENGGKPHPHVTTQNNSLNPIHPVIFAKVTLGAVHNTSPTVRGRKSTHLSEGQLKVKQMFNFQVGYKIQSLKEGVWKLI